MSDAFNTAEEELAFILGNDTSNDDNDVGASLPAFDDDDEDANANATLFADYDNYGALQEETTAEEYYYGNLTSLASPVKQHGFGTAAAANSDFMSQDISHSLSPEPALEDNDGYVDMSHPSIIPTISRMVSLSPTSEDSAPSYKQATSSFFFDINNSEQLQTSTSSSNLLMSQALNTTTNNNSSYNDPPVMSSLLPQAELDAFKIDLNNPNFDSMMANYETTNNSIMGGGINANTSANFTTSELQDLLGQFHPTLTFATNNNSQYQQYYQPSKLSSSVGGLYGDLFAQATTATAAGPPLPPPYADLFTQATANDTYSKSSPLNNTPNSEPKAKSNSINNNKEHAPKLLNTYIAPRGSTSSQSSKLNRSRPLRKRKVPQELLDFTTLLDFSATSATSSNASSGLAANGSGANDRIGNLISPRMFEELVLAKEIDGNVLNRSNDTARTARKLRRLSRAKSQVINLVGGGDVRDIMECAVLDSAATSSASSTAAKAGQATGTDVLIQEFTKNLDTKTFVETSWGYVGGSLACSIEKKPSVPGSPVSNPTPKAVAVTPTSDVVVPLNTTSSNRSITAASATAATKEDKLKNLPSGKDPESRKLRRLMRNRLSAQASRDRRKKAIEDAKALKQTKQNDITTLKSQVSDEMKQLLLLEKAVMVAKTYMTNQNKPEQSLGLGVSGNKAAVVKSM